ncbi:MAG: patatin-like phospholipase family protein [Pseudomonadota bacterium]|nr:patatin-like phospholipase family protein [Pseudomonadota bacterium]
MSQPLPPCDLIMKGGVTSGVVYPKMISRLARDFQFKNIGGTSTGAIAAAACAAAELGRQSGRNPSAFDTLAQLPEALGTDGRLLGLFQPAPAMRSHFRLALDFMGHRSVPRALLRITPWLPWLATTLAGCAGLAWTLQGHHLPWLLLVLCLALATGLFAGALAIGVWRFGKQLVAGLEDNFYGICSGLGQDALTDWLDGYLNSLAGLDATRPLIFRDLWGSGGEQDRNINLEVVTSALSQHASYAIPFRSGSGAFYFDPVAWRRLFPAPVIAWLMQQPNADHGVPPGSHLVRLPGNADLPVIVAVRMSLAFPLLLSSVPLYAHDFTEKTADGHATMKRIWFSDGGISSNLPLHFFDELLPEHPTFAINLKAAHPSHPIDDTQPCGSNNRVFLASNNHDGASRYWAAPAGGLTGFIGSIVATALRWRDESLFPYPGYRDRIVQVSLQDSEGGLHLAMSPAQIAAMAAAGACAGELLYRRFHPGAEGWPNHQRVRLQSVLGNLELLAVRAARAKPAGPWETAIDALQQTRYTHAQAALARHLLQELEEMGEAALTSGAGLAQAMYKPHPVLKLTPRA